MGKNLGGNMGKNLGGNMGKILGGYKGKIWDGNMGKKREASPVFSCCFLSPSLANKIFNLESK
jgi:hypothetical protein